MPRFLRILLWPGYTALLVSELMLALEPASSWPRPLRLLFLVLPLLLPLRGLLNGRPLSYIWASLLSLFYFTASIFSLAGTPHSKLALLELGASLTLFAGALGCARKTQRLSTTSR